MAMGKDKLKRFSQLTTFSNVIQPNTDYFNKEHHIKGTWNKILKIITL